jgi:DNA polymerase-1
VSILIIDSSYLIFRSFFAYSGNKLTHNNQPVGAFYGFAKTVISLVKKFQPEQLIFAKDLPTPTWRHKLYDAYKAGRPEIDPNMVAQIPVIHQWSSLVGETLELEGFEADDLIFSTAIQELGVEAEVGGKDLGLVFENPDKEVLIFSSDRDLYQLLVWPQIKFLRPQKTGEVNLYDQEAFLKEFSVNPKQWVDYKALVGDSSDNLKGLEGVGPKTAAVILKEIGSLYSFYQQIGLDPEAFSKSFHSQEEDKTKLKNFLENPKNTKLIEKMKAQHEQVKQTYLLATLQMVPQIRVSNKTIDFLAGQSIFDEYGFKLLAGEKSRQPKKEDLNTQDSLF